MNFPTLTPGQRFALPCPRPGADAWWLAQWVTHPQTSASAQVALTAVVCADAQDARRLQEDMRFFQPDLRIELFPDWETLPYDLFSPHQDLISERLATLWKIQQGEVDVVLVPATTALYRLAPPSFLAAHTFEFKVQQVLREQGVKSGAIFTASGLAPKRLFSLATASNKDLSAASCCKSLSPGVFGDEILTVK